MPRLHAPRRRRCRRDLPLACTASKHVPRQQNIVRSAASHLRLRRIGGLYQTRTVRRRIRAAAPSPWLQRSHHTNNARKQTEADKALAAVAKRINSALSTMMGHLVTPSPLGALAQPTAAWTGCQNTAANVHRTVRTGAVSPSTRGLLVRPSVQAAIAHPCGHGYAART